MKEKKIRGIGKEREEAATTSVDNIKLLINILESDGEGNGNERV